MSTDPTKNLNSNGTNFTSTIHHDTYPFITPLEGSLVGKNVLITGASKGIGRATALSFAKAGVSKIAICARTQSSLDSLAQEIKNETASPGPEILTVAVDTTSRPSVDHLASEIASKFGGIDLLINSAGYLEPITKLASSDPDAWWDSMTINLKGTYLITRAMIPLLLSRGPAGLKTIITLSSFGAHVILDGGSSYQLAKLAQLRLAEFVISEYGSEGIIAFCIHPGGVSTEMGLVLPEELRATFLTETVELPAHTLAWLAREKREWLGGRYVNVLWDMEEFLGKREVIEKHDLLKVRMAVE